MALELYGVFTLWCRMIWLSYMAFELYGVFENREKYGIILSYMAFFAALAAEIFEKSGFVRV